MIRARAYLRRFRRSETGSATVEFAIMLPVMFSFFLSTFELGMLLSRQVMLDRGVDIAVRAVRIGTLDPVTHDTLKQTICQAAMIIPDCLSSIRLEMRTEDPRNWAAMPTDADCIDREDEANPLRMFVPGTSNQLMILRACVLFDPYLPTSGLGASIPKESGGEYALLSTTSFVIEPQ